MKYNSQHCCVKTMDDKTTKWPYIANVVFQLYKIMMNKDIFVSLTRSDRPCLLSHTYDTPS